MNLWDRMKCEVSNLDSGVRSSPGKILVEIENNNNMKHRNHNIFTNYCWWLNIFRQQMRQYSSFQLSLKMMKGKFNIVDHLEILQTYF